MAASSYRFPVQQAAFLRAVAEGVYRGAGRSAGLPRAASLVGRMPPVYQQALQGSCVPSAVTALLEYFTDLRTRLSVQFLFAATKEIEREGVERNLVRLSAGEPLDAGFESVFHREIVQLQMLADANGGMGAPVVRPYLLRFEEGVRERFAAAQGCLLQSCFRALETYGVCRYGLWPYASAQGASAFGPGLAGRVEFPPGAREDAAKRRIVHGLYRLATPNNVDEIRGILAGANGRRAMPVVVTVDFFAGCDGETYAFPATETDGEGRLVSVDAWQGRHGLLIVGYADDAAFPGGGYFEIRNSLGEGWGRGGYGRLPYAYLECFALEAGTILQDRIDYEGDGYGGQRRIAAASAPPPRRLGRRLALNAAVAVALVAGTIAVGAYFDDPLGLRRAAGPAVPGPRPAPGGPPRSAPGMPPPFGEGAGRARDVSVYKVFVTCENEEERKALREALANEGVPFAVEFVPTPLAALMLYVTLPGAGGAPDRAVGAVGGVLRSYYKGPRRQEIWANVDEIRRRRLIYVVRADMKRWDDMQFFKTERNGK